MPSTLAHPTGNLSIELGPDQPGWLDAVLGDFDAFLADHASCEKKASGMALNMASHYPDRPRLLRAMMDLAVEELGHYREVVRLILNRGSAPLPDTRDAYVNALNGLIRKGREPYLVDRLLVAALIEARGAQRFAQIAEAHTDTELRRFYRAIAASEMRHWMLFTELAEHYFPDWPLADRLQELSASESAILRAQPARPALH